MQCWAFFYRGCQVRHVSTGLFAWIIPMNWLGISEIVVGKTILGELNASVIDASKVHPSYSGLVVLLQDGVDENRLVEKYGFSVVHVCRQAAQAVNGAPLDYVGLLERASLRSDVGRTLLGVAKKLEAGDDADIGKATAA